MRELLGYSRIWSCGCLFEELLDRFEAAGRFALSLGGAWSVWRLVWLLGSVARIGPIAFGFGDLVR